MTYRPTRILLACIAFLLCVIPFVETSTLAAGQSPAQNQAPTQTQSQTDLAAQFRTSDHCIICHSGMKTAKGENFSIGTEWRGSIMANSARDPYWQGSVRRETIDHPEVSGAIQDDCANCHMPLQHLQDKAQSRETELFKRLPLRTGQDENAAAADGVSCAVCHQVQPKGLNTPDSYNGNFTVAGPDVHPRTLFGPFTPSTDQVVQFHAAATGYVIHQSDHMKDSALCGSCHTLTTTVRGPGGKAIGSFPEQRPYVEWLHSSYRDKQSCQQCHMPAVADQVAIAALMSTPRDDVHRHSFVGANFLMSAMLDTHHDELGVSATPAELEAAAERTKTFLQTAAARVTLSPATRSKGQLSFAVQVENLTGHKLPTAFPSRRAWLHVTVTTADGHVVFESGKLNADGSIQGNANDADPTRFSPHYTRITNPNQVQIFEPILGDGAGHVTTGLLTASQYLKDNRILPAGFDKATASPDIAVRGGAAADRDFAAGSSTTRYAIAVNTTGQPLRIAAELVYQPIGFRWAHNLATYKAGEPQQFVQYYEQAAAHSSLVLAHAEAAAQ